MGDPEKLGGFKVLKEAALLKPDPFEPDKRLPVTLFRVLAEHEINLSYVTCIREDLGRWEVNIVVDFKDTRTACRLLAETLHKRPHHHPRAAILSIFPHRKKPAITGALFEAMRAEGIHMNAVAHSPAAISAVMEEDELLKASSALFGPFAFSAYRTPADWKLAQMGKEKLYKEVVASYQEKHPKVYGLEYQDQQEMLRITIKPTYAEAVGNTFESVSRNGLDLNFLVASGSPKKADSIVVCLPLRKSGSNKESIARILKPSQIETHHPVGTFSMNGPHFGDRYGIIHGLLSALESARVDLMGLSCTIASITGIVPSTQLPSAIKAIQNSFDVPSILKTDRVYE